jgi:ATP-binding cassette subfamily F protein uup
LAILTLNNLYLSYSDAPLFDHADLTIEENDRIAVVGRNGAGKSTLLKIIEGSITPDEVVRNERQNLRIARLEQDPPAHLDLSVYAYVARGIPVVGEYLAQFFLVSNLLNDVINSDITDD